MPLVEPRLDSVRVARADERRGRTLALGVVDAVQGEAPPTALVDEVLRQLGRPGADRFGADLVDDLHAGAGDVRVDDRGCARVQARGGWRPVEDLGLEGVGVAPPEPAGDGRMQSVEQIAPRVEECDARHAHQVLEVSRRQEVDAERLDVDGVGAEGLVGVDEQERASGVGLLGNGSQVLLEPVLVVRVRRRDQQRLVVQVPVVVLQVHDLVAHRHPIDPEAVFLKRHPHLADAGELGFGRYDLATPTGRVERADQARARFRDRGRDGDLIRGRVDQPSELHFGAVRLLGPLLPVHTVAVPRVQVGFGGGPGAHHLRALRAGVECGVRLQEGDTGPPRGHVVARTPPSHGRRRKLGLGAHDRPCAQLRVTVHIPRCGGVDGKCTFWSTD